jgi:hypothetical protein
MTGYPELEIGWWQAILVAVAEGGAGAMASGSAFIGQTLLATLLPARLRNFIGARTTDMRRPRAGGGHRQPRRISAQRRPNPWRRTLQPPPPIQSREPTVAWWGEQQ